MPDSAYCTVLYRGWR